MAQIQVKYILDSKTGLYKEVYWDAEAGTWLDTRGTQYEGTSPTPPPGPTPSPAPITGPTAEQQADYKDYLAFIKQYPDLGLPVPKDINDFIAHQAEWEAEYAPPTPTPTPTPTYTDDQTREYYTYRNYSSAYRDPADWNCLSIDDYFKNYDIAQEQLNEWKQEEKDQQEPTYTDAQNREYNSYKRYASAYGGPKDEYALNIKDYLDNRDAAQEQLNKWKAEEAEAEKYDLPPEEYARRREESYKAAQEARERAEKARIESEKYDLSPEEQARRREESYKYSQEAKAKQAEADKYDLTPEEYARRREESYAYTQEQRALAEQYQAVALSPEEEARRREESYQSALESRARAEYAAQEAYGETPAYPESFSNWLQTQGSQSQYLKDFIESKYPSLKTQYEAKLPTLTGYPTREAARAEATKREKGFQAWLPTQQKVVETEFWGQAPARRGERPGAFAPRMRYAQW